MQDIYPPQKRSKKRLKITLLVLAGIFLLLLAVAVTYFLTKQQLQSKKEEKKPQATEQEAKEEGEFVYITSKAGLNMREDASTTSAIIYTLPYRAKVKLEKKSQDGKWYKGVYDDVKGWFSADYTQKEEPEDLTPDWLLYESQAFGYSLKYPEDWQKKSQPQAGYDFEITPKSTGSVSISVQIKETTLDKEKAALVDPEHAIVGETLIVIGGIKGKKFVVQKTKNSKIISATDIILLEKDGKIIRVEGPADNEQFGDIFNLLTWTIKFKVL